MTPLDPTPYDETPYPSGPYRQTHPDRLYALARFFGMSPQDVRRCRVLELGAADGSNLIPMAIAFPESRFVGIELSRTHVESGLETIDRLGLSNIELRHLDILSVDEDFGPFDYVIVHGVYSWVPPPVQTKILNICSERLTEQGVAYVSYNANPGWRMRGLLRDMMLYHTRKFDDPRLRVEQARALVAWLAETVDSEGDPYGMLLKRELEQMHTWHDAYFRHDSLAEINEPLYFNEFIERAEAHGLQYLAEAELTPMLASNYSAPVDAALNRMGRDIIELEQYMDFLRNRMFRQTLLCHRATKLNRALGPWSVDGFHIAAALRVATVDPDYASEVEVTFRGARELSITTGNSLVKAAMTCLGEAWPEAIPFRELLDRSYRFLADRGVITVPSEPTEADHTVLGGAVLTSYTKGLCELHGHAGTFVASPGQRPCACPLARLQALRGEPATNRRHERVFLDAFAQRLLQLLDGRSDRADLLERLNAEVLDGTLVLDAAASPVESRAQVHAVLEAELERVLRSLGHKALLVG